MKDKNLIFLAIVIGIFTACEILLDLSEPEYKKNTQNDENLSETLKSTEIEATEIAENAFEEISYEAEFYAESEKVLRNLSHACGIQHLLVEYCCDRYNNGIIPDISIDTSDAGFPIMIEIIYGDNTTVSSGRNITGKINIEISENDTLDALTQKIIFNNCLVDDVNINGESIRIIDTDNRTEKIIATKSNVTFTINESSKYYRTSELKREWISGLDTPLEHHDDEIKVSGVTTITSMDGVSWQRVISEPLVRLADYHNYVQGAIEIIQNKRLLATLKYV